MTDSDIFGNLTQPRPNDVAEIVIRGNMGSRSGILSTVKGLRGEEIITVKFTNIIRTRVL